MKRVTLEPAYILHTRAYRETSLLVELFSAQHGRLSAVARGVRQRRSSWTGLLQPFVPVLVSFSGRGDLLTLSQVEARGKSLALAQTCLYAGLYLNELLFHLVQKWDAHEPLFYAYERAILALQNNALLDERILRSFEKVLLQELGYGVLPKTEQDLARTFSPDHHYCFMTNQGFVSCEPEESNAHALQQTAIFSGRNLLAIAREEWQEDILRDARRLTRLVLKPLLGDKQIHSRYFFMRGQDEK